MIPSAWIPALSGGLALVGVLLLTPLVIRLARRQGWVANPRADRWHEKPTALMGGLAIYAAATLGLLTALGVASFPWTIWAGASMLFVAGFVDDRWGLNPVSKLVTQILATLLLIYGGYVFGAGLPFWLTVPLTFLWVIGITNAINLLDNMDGLAAGVTAIVAIVLAAFALVAGGNGASVAAMTAVAGASAGFLAFNFKPARIFMGDCGSLFLGFSLAAFSIAIQGQISGVEGLAVYAVSIAILAVPIFDTTLVTLARTLSGRSVSQGGQDHSSHRLVQLGLSERRAVVTLYAVGLAFGALALLFHYAEVRLFYSLLAFCLVGLAVFGIHLGSVNVYERTNNGTTSMPLHRRAIALLRRLTGARTASILRALLGRSWKPLLGLAADLVLVSAAFVVAHYLRFENGLPAAQETLLITVLPGVVALKLLVFFVAGLYRGMWRHAGVPELIRIFVATTVASGLTFGALAAIYGVGALSVSVFVIDWLIVTLVITVVRFGFRGLHQYFRARQLSGKRVLVCGAGDAGLLILRAIRQRANLGLEPVGFLDENAYKRGYTAQGLAVLGTPDEIESVCNRHGVEEVLVPAWVFSEERQMDIFAACDRIDVACRVFDLSLQPSPETSNGLPKEVTREKLVSSKVRD